MNLPGIPDALQRSLDSRGYAQLTDVQSAVLAPEAAGRDLIVSARTGSGKTVAYGLAMAPTLLAGAARLAPAPSPLALIVAPTRELALQVERELTWLYAATGARIAAAVGGMDPRRERRLLEEGPHIVVGTPGRLCDHIRRKALDLGSLKVIVLDEADEMLDLGFREDLEFILSQTPPERRSLLFSATLPKAIVALAKQYQSQALRIEASSGESGHADIEYRVYRVLAEEISLAIVNILRHSEAESAIIFCNTREAVRRLQALLAERGFSAVFLSGELSQHERNHALQALRDGRVRICVATDVAARGIDLPNLGLVIHAELPSNAEVLQHRSGRTGRAGRKGISALLVAPSRRRRAELLLAQGGISAQWLAPPSVEEIRRQDAARFLADPLLSEAADEEDFALGAQLLGRLGPEFVAATLARLYRARLPAPEELAIVQPERAGKAGRAAGEKGRAKGELPPHQRLGETIWFRLEIGRKNRADPKWILPMLCRRGRIERGAIGAIRIEDAYTDFEIAADSAPGFADAMRAKDSEDIAITRLGETRPQGSAPARHKPRFEPHAPARSEPQRPDVTDRHPAQSSPSRAPMPAIEPKAWRKGGPGKNRPSPTNAPAPRRDRPFAKPAAAKDWNSAGPGKPKARKPKPPGR